MTSEFLLLQWQAKRVAGAEAVDKASSLVDMLSILKFLPVFYIELARRCRHRREPYDVPTAVRLLVVGVRR